MRTTRIALALVLAVTGCAASRAEELRAKYRSNAIDESSRELCLREPSRCRGYGKTYWRMPRPEVEGVTGCSLNGLDCVVEGETFDERYVFGGGALRAVIIDYWTWEKGLGALTASLGEPGWRGHNTDVLDAWLAQARSRQRGAAVLGGEGLPAGGPWGGWYFPPPGTVSAVEITHEVASLEAQRAATPQKLCASWYRQMTWVLLCEGDGRTRALFTSRVEPDTTMITGWHGKP